MLEVLLQINAFPIDVTINIVEAEDTLGGCELCERFANGPREEVAIFRREPVRTRGHPSAWAKMWEVAPKGDLFILTEPFAIRSIR